MVDRWEFVRYYTYIIEKKAKCKLYIRICLHSMEGRR